MKLGQDWPPKALDLSTDTLSERTPDVHFGILSGGKTSGTVEDRPAPKRILEAGRSGMHTHYFRSIFALMEVRASLPEDGPKGI